MYDRKADILSDSPLKKTLYKLFKKRDRLTILDIGGCEGEDSIKYPRLFPWSSIFVFEPLPKNQQHIIKNIQQYQTSNIELIPKALSDVSGSLNFYVSSGRPDHHQENLDWDFGNKSSSLLAPDQHIKMFPWLQFNEVLAVSAISLSEFLEQRNMTEVDFIHMDVQGAELKVLVGAKEMIKNVKAIWLEVADISLYKGQPLRIDIEVFMKNHGFYLIKSSMNGQFGDQLYLNQKYFRTLHLLSGFLKFHFKKPYNISRLFK